MRSIMVLFGLVFAAATPTTVNAISWGCSSGSGRPNELFVQASYGVDPSTLFTFYVDGPEYRLIYEGHEPRSFAIWLTDLAPGAYTYYVHYHQLAADGSYIDVDKKLSDCTVYGVVATPTPDPTPEPTPQPTPKPTPNPVATPKPTVAPVAPSTPEMSDAPTESAAPTPTETPLVAVAPVQPPPPTAPLDPQTESATLVDLDLSKMGAIVAGGLIPLALLALLVLVRRRRSQAA